MLDTLTTRPQNGLLERIISIPFGITYSLTFPIGVPIPPDTYAVSAIILLPINAAMNPFLYTTLIDYLWEMTTPIRRLFKSTVPSQATEMTAIRSLYG